MTTNQNNNPEPTSPTAGPWLRGDELEAVMPTLKEGDVVEVGYKGHTATGELWSAGLGCLVMWRRTVRTSKGEPDFYVDALRIIERAPEPEPGADIPDEVVAAAVEAATREWDSGRSVAYSDAMRAALAAADAKRAELADDVESERSLRIQMARELLVLTRAAELPDPSAEDFGGVGKRILAALGVES